MRIHLISTPLDFTFCFKRVHIHSIEIFQHWLEDETSQCNTNCYILLSLLNPKTITHNSGTLYLKTPRIKFDNSLQSCSSSLSHIKYTLALYDNVGRLRETTVQCGNGTDALYPSIVVLILVFFSRNHT